ncbi:predicted protein, partial [Naegleria gruberi]
ENLQCSVDELILSKNELVGIVKNGEEILLHIKIPNRKNVIDLEIFKTKHQETQIRIFWAFIEESLNRCDASYVKKIKTAENETVTGVKLSKDKTKVKLRLGIEKWIYYSVKYRQFLNNFIGLDCWKLTEQNTTITNESQKQLENNSQDVDDTQIDEIVDSSNFFGVGQEKPLEIVGSETQTEINNHSLEIVGSEMEVDIVPVRQRVNRRKIPPKPAGPIK